MVGKSGFISFVLGLVAFVADVRANGACTEEELTRLGFLVAPTTNEEKQHLIDVTECLRKVGKASLTITAPKDTPKVAKKLEKAFTKQGIDYLSMPCITCFAASVQCATNHCKGPCLQNQYSPNCRKCVKEHCEEGFKNCVGHEIIDPAEYQL